MVQTQKQFYLAYTSISLKTFFLKIETLFSFGGDWTVEKEIFFLQFFKLLKVICLYLPINSINILFFFITKIQFIILPIPLPIRTLIDFEVKETLGKQYIQILYLRLQSLAIFFIQALICAPFIIFDFKAFNPIIPINNLKCLNSFFFNLCTIIEL